MSLKDEIRRKNGEAEEQERLILEDYYATREEKINEIANSIIEDIRRELLKASPKDEYMSKSFIFNRITKQKYLVASIGFELRKSNKLWLGVYGYDDWRSLLYVSPDDLKRIDSIVVSYLNKEQIKKCYGWHPYRKGKHEGYVIDGISDFTPSNFDKNSIYFRQGCNWLVYAMFLSL